MKKRPRYRRRPIGEEESRAARPVEPPAQEKPAPPEPACAEKSGDAKPEGAPSGKMETVLGFGLLGATVGFLWGYGEMNLFNGIANGIVGFLAGIVTGYLPFLSVKQ
jgi:hypothetical protein